MSVIIYFGMMAFVILLGLGVLGAGLWHHYKTSKTLPKSK